MFIIISVDSNGSYNVVPETVINWKRAINAKVIKLIKNLEGFNRKNPIKIGRTIPNGSFSAHWIIFIHALAFKSIRINFMTSINEKFELSTFFMSTEYFMVLHEHQLI
jgi:hypothetical protein